MAFFNFSSFGFAGFAQSFSGFSNFDFGRFFNFDPPVAEPEPVEPPAENIVDIAAGSDDFNILVKALDVAGLVDTVRGLDDVTVFAPTDVAFTQLAVDLGFDGDTSSEDGVFDFIAGALADLSDNGDPIPLLTDILLYHVSPGEKTAAEIEAEDTIATLLDGATFAPEDGALRDNEPDIDDPQIAVADIEAENGTIQAIDRVLLPIDIPGNEQPSIVDIAAESDDFDILVKALTTVDLVDTLQAADDITVFAPTDAAFTQLATDLGFEGDTDDEDGVFNFIAGALTDLAPDGDPIPLLTDILLYHVSPGAKSLDDLNEDVRVETLLEGATITSAGNTLVDAEPDVENPDIVIADLEAANGTIQVIDRVLLPVDIPGNEQADDPQPEEAEDFDVADIFPFLAAKFGQDVDFDFPQVFIPEFSEDDLKDEEDGDEDLA